MRVPQDYDNHSPTRSAGEATASRIISIGDLIARLLRLDAHVLHLLACLHLAVVRHVGVVDRPGQNVEIDQISHHIHVWIHLHLAEVVCREGT